MPPPDMLGIDWMREDDVRGSCSSSSDSIMSSSLMLEFPELLGAILTEIGGSEKVSLGHRAASGALVDGSMAVNLSRRTPKLHPENHNLYKN